MSEISTMNIKIFIFISLFSVVFSNAQVLEKGKIYYNGSMTITTYDWVNNGGFGDSPMETNIITKLLVEENLNIKVYYNHNAKHYIQVYKYLGPMDESIMYMDEKGNIFQVVSGLSPTKHIILVGERKKGSDFGMAVLLQDL